MAKLQKALYIGDFESTEFQSLLAEHQEHFFYPEEFGIYLDDNLNPTKAKYYINKEQLKRINYSFMAGVIQTRKGVICAKFLGSYGNFFNDLASQVQGTLGEIGMLLYSGYKLESCVQENVSEEDTRVVMQEFNIAEDDTFQQKVTHLQSSILFKMRILFKPHQDMFWSPNDFLTSKEVYDRIRHTRVEELLRGQYDLLTRLRNM